MQQAQMQQTNRIHQTPTPPPQPQQQSAPLLAQLQTPTSSSQVNCSYYYHLFKRNKAFPLIVIFFY